MSLANRHGLALLTMVCASLLSGCVLSTSDARDLQRTLAVAACGTPEPAGGSPWHFQRLFNCDDETFYIPFQLWTGAKWNGDREAGCMHAVDHTFMVNGTSQTRISGPYERVNPISATRENYWKREKLQVPKVQYFTCHELGIGHVFDNRFPKDYASGRCEFPAGPGWQVGQKRQCDNTTIEVTRFELNAERELNAIEFKWWYGNTLDHVYRYVREQGMTAAWRVPRKGELQSNVSKFREVQ